MKKSLIKNFIFCVVRNADVYENISTQQLENKFTTPSELISTLHPISRARARPTNTVIFRFPPSPIPRLRGTPKILLIDVDELEIYHYTNKWSFPLRISSINVTKSAGNCEFSHIYWRNSERKTSFFFFAVNGTVKNQKVLGNFGITG